MGKVARMKLQYFGHVRRYQRKCRKFGTDSLEGQCRWLIMVYVTKEDPKDNGWTT